MAEHLALVTGGSSGIGLEISRLLAEAGNDLIITSCGHQFRPAKP
jgi:NAD(P)-dependent dehydrogenase (short-subunit alcohol dehydrogenase family)